MNWTGGQLHRSARQGTLSKNQRQYFAKSRQVASRHLSSFPGLPEFANTKDIQSAAFTNSQDVVTDGKSQMPALTPPRLPGASTTTGGTRLDSLKRQLLQDPDWAAVSAARPLEMTFTPAEEIERFGKRRKLNDHDRQRLSAAYGHQSLSDFATLCRKSRDASPRDVRLDQITIRIDGCPAGLHSSSQGKSTNVPSSRSMLLDNETSLISHSPGRESETLKPECLWVAKSSRLSLQPRYSRPMIEKFLAGIRRSPVSGDTEPFDNVIPGTPETKKFPANSPPYRSQVKSDRIECQSLIAVDQPRQPRYFIIDDQILPEPTEHTVALNWHAPSFSPAKTLMASPAPSRTDTFSHRQRLNWLSQPGHLNDSRSPYLGRVRAANLPGSIANQSSYLNSTIDPFRDPAKAHSLSTPTVLFGQLVRNDNVVENV
ncbi:uncharacterized protein N7498_006898 [Penicillium cinerascens]|uniref:Uncharacterized protein n=1 Tax=Penicillium cinerascens TaxID=70096 RepID=A0A9W9JKK9_9EURO|nr:uncharacterized protein N7498_006898 [Penicillium cinerascens]KAJ5197781.1 hypothetical protein N7498_006898 [Penicillium cinerascens]